MSDFLLMMVCYINPTGVQWCRTVYQNPAHLSSKAKGHTSNTLLAMMVQALGSNSVALFLVLYVTLVTQMIKWHFVHSTCSLPFGCWWRELPAGRLSVMFSLHLSSNSVVLSVHYSLIVWHFPVTCLCLHKRLPQVLCRFFLLTSLFHPPPPLLSLFLFFFICLNFVLMCCVRKAFRELRTCLWQVKFSVQAAILTGSISCPRHTAFTLFCSTALAYSFSQKSSF